MVKTAKTGEIVERKHTISFVDPKASGDRLHRLNLYDSWLQSTRKTWIEPDLVTYRDYLLINYKGRDGKSLTVTSVRAHLSTVRGRYRELLRQPSTRDYLYGMTPANSSAADKKAFVDEVVQRIESALDPDNAKVRITSRQDVADETHLRLRSTQADTLMQAPDRTTLLGLRDASIISLMLCTGIREAELCALDVKDLYQHLGGESALHIRHGKGSKERLVPYGKLEWVLDIVSMWLSNAGIEDGAVFRGFYRGGQVVRSTRLTVRAINQILDRYPILIDGTLRPVNPHDLRRTYARLMYESGVDLLAIRDNLGHADSRTTLRYIGTMDVNRRQPPTLYTFGDQLKSTSVKSLSEKD